MRKGVDTERECLRGLYDFEVSQFGELVLGSKNSIDQTRIAC